MNELDALLRDFNRLADANNWYPKHSPKNLSMAIAVEAAELMENFQWQDDAIDIISDSQREGVSQEIADVFLYLLCLADKLDIDIIKASQNKMLINHQRSQSTT